MAHRVGLGPGGPILFQTTLEPPRLFCSILDCLVDNWKGLDLTGHKALKYSFIELLENVHRAPGPSTNRYLQCAQCCHDWFTIIWNCFVRWDGPLIPRILGKVVLSLPKTISKFEQWIVPTL